MGAKTSRNPRRLEEAKSGYVSPWTGATSVAQLRKEFDANSRAEMFGVERVTAAEVAATGWNVNIGGLGGRRAANVLARLQALKCRKVWVVDPAIVENGDSRTIVFSKVVLELPASPSERSVVFGAVSKMVPSRGVLPDVGQRLMTLFLDGLGPD